MSVAAGQTPLVAMTVRAALAEAAGRLEAAGCATPRLDAEVLLAEALSIDRTALFARPERELPEDAAARFAGYVERRAGREPVAYVVGRRGFRRIELAVDPQVLIPRPETELLVEVALRVLARGAAVHDVGTGSGAVALALKHERPDLVVRGSDASAGAIEVARANAARLGLEVELEVAQGLPPRARESDLVVANLPYVRDDEWPHLAPEITDHEPQGALLGGGEDGLDAIRELIDSPPSGMALALEHAPAQAAAVRTLLRGPLSHRGPGGAEDVTVGRAP